MAFDPITAPTVAVGDAREPIFDHTEQTATARQRLDRYVSERGRRPNFLVVLFDDVGWGDFGCYGGGIAVGAPTPNIDRLAREGTRFTDFYVAQPVCTASRAAFFTGCYSNRVGMAGALNHTSTTGIHPDERLLSELFKTQGYATAIYGKWHLGHGPPFLPTRRGFDASASGTWARTPSRSRRTSASTTSTGSSR